MFNVPLDTLGLQMVISETVCGQSLALVLTRKTINSKINQINTNKLKIQYTNYINMHTNVILNNKRRTHAQSNYTNTKLKAWFRRPLCHPARKWSGFIPF